MWTGADPSPRATSNARALEAELQWLDHVLQLRLAGHFGQDGAPASPHAAADRGELPLPPPLPATPDDDLTRLIREGGLGPAERLVLALALAPHLRPQLMDLLFVSNRNLDRGFCEFGGWKGRHHGGFLPTVETAAFLLAGEDLSRRFALRQMLDWEKHLTSAAAAQTEKVKMDSLDPELVERLRTLGYAEDAGDSTH